MKLDELLVHSRYILSRREIMSDNEVMMSQSIIDILGEDQPCGFEPPTVMSDKNILAGDLLLTPAEARAYAAMLVRAAEQVESKD
jgi:hypothetical protein